MIELLIIGLQFMSMMSYKVESNGEQFKLPTVLP
jgi:hypothetical protein